MDALTLKPKSGNSPDLHHSNELFHMLRYRTRSSEYTLPAHRPVPSSSNTAQILQRRKQAEKRGCPRWRDSMRKVRSFRQTVNCSVSTICLDRQQANISFIIYSANAKRGVECVYVPHTRPLAHTTIWISAFERPERPNELAKQCIIKMDKQSSENRPKRIRHRDNAMWTGAMRNRACKYAGRKAMSGA